MARFINGGTDRISYQLPVAAGGLFTVALRFRTTVATANVQLFGHWSNGSRNGLGVLLNITAGKITIAGYDASTQRMAVLGSPTVNDGNWHSLVVSCNATNGGTNTIYVDGTSAGSTTSSAQWGAVAGTNVVLGDSLDSFWGSYVGDIADVGFWNGLAFSANDAATYNQGFSPVRIRPDGLELYAPLVRDHQCKMGTTLVSLTGTTVSDHPRVIGSLI